jgi:hypothetical protein
MQANRQISDDVEVLKRKKCYPRILLPEEYLSKRWIKDCFVSDKQKLREFITNNPVLQEMLKKAL